MLPNEKELISLIPEKNYRDLRFIQEEIKKSGHTSYLIGGSVRDLLLNHIPDEYDLTTSLHPNGVKSLFKRVIETGIKHGTVTVLIKDCSYEITTFRTESKYSDGRHPDSIEFGTSLSEDILRRDFTMNAIALDLLDEVLIDEHNGISDIQNKIIRTIGNPVDRFSEDGLRPIRAIRFHSTLGFTIDEQTYSAIQKTREITSKISRERFHDELMKILKTPSPLNGLKELLRHNFFSLFWGVDEIEADCMTALMKLPRIQSSELSLRIAYLFFHLLEDTKKIETVLRNLKFSNERIKIANFSIPYFSKISENLWSSENIKHDFSNYLQTFGKNSVREGIKYFSELANLMENSRFSSEITNKLNSILERNEPLLLSDLSLNGNDLKLNFPDLDKKEYGTALKSCLDLVLNDPEKNQKEELITFLRKKGF